MLEIMLLKFSLKKVYVLVILVVILDVMSCFHVLRRMNVTSEIKYGTKVEGKIVGGVPVPIEQYPFAVMVFNFGALCGGCILSSWAVLTAAHCFDMNDDVFDISIHAGARYKFDTRAQVYPAQHLERHEDYNKAMPFACDIAILFTKSKISFTERVQRALIVNSDVWMKRGEGNFAVTGWGMVKYNGAVSSKGLLMTHLHYVPRDECGRLHDMTFTKDMFCLYGDGKRDSCKGDSGGGVLWKGLLVGVVSHGDGCANKDKPSVYGNVYYFKNWINATINNFYKNKCQTS